jgi:hypothetical protein
MRSAGRQIGKSLSREWKAKSEVTENDDENN